VNLRTIKILLVASMALYCLFYALQNLVNMEQGIGAVAYVMGNVDHQSYPGSFGPSITQSWLISLAFGIIVAFETLAGLLAARGAIDMIRARHGSAQEFMSATRYAALGAGVAMLVWFGLFGVIGGAFFQQWQTQAGALSLEGAFQYGGMAALIILFVRCVSDEV